MPKNLLPRKSANEIFQQMAQNVSRWENPNKIPIQIFLWILAGIFLTHTKTKSRLFFLSAGFVGPHNIIASFVGVWPMLSPLQRDIMFDKWIFSIQNFSFIFQTTWPTIAPKIDMSKRFLEIISLPHLRSRGKSVRDQIAHWQNAAGEEVLTTPPPVLNGPAGWVVVRIKRWSVGIRKRNVRRKEQIIFFGRGRKTHFNGVGLFGWRLHLWFAFYATVIPCKQKWPKKTISAKGLTTTNMMKGISQKMKSGRSKTSARMESWWRSFTLLELVGKNLQEVQRWLCTTLGRGLF